MWAGRGGRIVKTMGDGLLLEFPSVVAAVECAAAIQKMMVERNVNTPKNNRIVYRVGIHLGDVLIEGEDIIGEGVNIAARLERSASPAASQFPDRFMIRSMERSHSISEPWPAKTEEHRQAGRSIRNRTNGTNLMRP